MSQAPNQSHEDASAAFLNLAYYLATKATCYADHHDTLHHHPTDIELEECAKYLSEWPNVRVLDQWQSLRPEPEVALELAVRYMSGCSPFKVNPEAALKCLDAFHNPEPEPDSRHAASFAAAAASQSDRARAHSCAAHAHYHKFTAPDTVRPVYASLERHTGRREAAEGGFGCLAHTCLTFALHHASESARLGLVSAVVLHVGFAAREIAEGFGVDFGEVVRRAKRYRPLWRAVDDRVNELYAEARTAEGATRRPDCSLSNEYVCGAEGCNARSNLKTGASFKTCAGKCPQDLKPRYCSKQCQVKDWSRHRVICKPGYGDKIPKISEKSIALEWFELGEPESAPASPAREAKSDFSDVLVSVDFRAQDGGPDSAMDIAGYEKGYRAIRIDCTVSEHPTGSVSQDTVEESSNGHAQDDEGKDVSRPPSLGVAPATRQDSAMDDKKADCATHEPPRGAAERNPADDWEAGEEVTRLMLTQPVFADEDHSPRPWARCYRDMRDICFFDYRDPRDPSSESEPIGKGASLKELEGLSIPELSQRWQGSEPEGRPAATLEMALRYITGACTVRCQRNPQAALLVLTAFHTPPHNSDSKQPQGEAGHVSATASRTELARAHALAAQAHYQVLMASDEERAGWQADFWRRPQKQHRGGGGAGGAQRQPTTTRTETQKPPHESLRLALHHANGSAALGLVATTCLGLGMTAREIGESFGVSLKGGVDVGALARRAKCFRALWGAVDEFLSGVYAEAREALRLERAADSSAGECVTVCGRKGCGRRESAAKAGSAGFKACAGKCPSDLKPRYCSKECQVKDWSRHKKVCKPGFAFKIPKIPDLKAVALEWFELEEPEPETEPHTAESDLSTLPFLADVQPKNNDPERIVDDGKRLEGDSLENNASETVVLEESAVLVQDEHTICEREDLQDVQYDDSASPIRDHARADVDSLDHTRSSSQRASPAEAIECSSQEVEDCSKIRDAEHATFSTSTGASESQWESEDTLSSPDSEGGPLTPSGLRQYGLPRPLVFGCMTPEYMKKLWEEEGPGAWMDSGVWAANPPSAFRARC